MTRAAHAGPSQAEEPSRPAAARRQRHGGGSSPRARRRADPSRKDRAAGPAAFVHSRGSFTVLSLFASPAVALVAAFATFLVIPTAPDRELTREELVDRALRK